VDFLDAHGWFVVMPDGSFSTSFLIRPDQIETCLALGRHVNAAHFSSASYETERQLFSSTVGVPIAVDTAGNDSYFKFNLDYINLYTLNRLEPGVSGYNAAYDLLRGATVRHQNASFNVIDLALRGPNDSRDKETLALLDGWLLRPRRDFATDLHGTVPVCGDSACQPVPIWLRPPSDFIWQRSPFQLASGGAGLIESAGIDYMLPYWMARYYGLQEAIVVQSAAAPIGIVAPDSLAAMFGSNLASTTQQATSLPLPTSLGGVTVTVQDAAGMTASLRLLYVSPTQINFLVPSGLATGVAIFTIRDGTRPAQTATAAVGQVAPALFSMDGSGSGIAAATALRVNAGNPSLQAPVPLFDCTSLPCKAVPVNLGIDTPVYLTLYGTGIRNSTSGDVQVTINGIIVPILFAGAQPDFAGLDQINVPLPLSLRGAGVVNIVLSAGRRRANTVTVAIQ
jgi:uncharacterized protein (TIGR03437 family)